MDNVLPTRILYLSYDGLTDPLGQSQILPYILGLTKKGFSFVIISFEKEEVLQKNQDAISAICRANNISWIICKYHKNPPIISTLFDLWTLWRKVKETFGTRSFQIVHCRSYITSLIGLRAKNRWGAKFIFDMRGFWADERVEGRLWNLKNPLYRLVYDFFKKKEKQFIIEADHIVSLTHNAKYEIESWGIASVPITVIPTCVDLDLFDSDKIKKEDQTHLRTKLGISEDSFVLLYLGSWGTWYHTEKMLDFFGELRKRKLTAKFLIVTTDTVDLEKRQFKSDVIVASSSRKNVPLYISISDASICFLKESFSKKASSATKMGEIMAMNVPVIANKGWGDIDHMANEAPVLLAELDNYGSFLNDTTFSKVNDLRVFCETNLSLAMSIERYCKIYAELENN